MAVVKRKQLSGWLAPFLKRESAIKALQEMLVDDKVTRGGMYCLELINQITQNGTQILERIPQEVFCGCPEGGRRNVAASALCRAGNGAVPTEPDAPGEDGLTRAQRIVGSWAERDGCWSDYTDTDQKKAGRLHDPDNDGSEARVYFDKGYVYKAIDFSHYPSMAAFMDRITIHNAVFPETAMTVEGFGWRDDASDYKDYVVVVKQPYVVGTPPESDELMDEVKRQIEEKGFTELLGLFYVSESGNLLLTDIHNRNCVFSDKGTLLVFDCEAVLNQTPELGGRYVIPALQYDDSAVKEIIDIINDLTPECVPVETLLDPESHYFKTAMDRQEAVKGLRSGCSIRAQLCRSQEEDCILQINPNDAHECLILPVKSAARMLENSSGLLDDGRRLDKKAISALSEGRVVTIDGTNVFFNLDKGRLDSDLSGIKLNLKHREDNAPKQTWKY